MQNLEQIRAGDALNAARSRAFAGKNRGEVVKKVPAMIRESGLLAALAFALERNDKDKLKNEGHFAVFQAVTEHLGKDRDPDALMDRLSSRASSTELREDTVQTLSYLAYLRRFADKEGKRS